MALCRDSVTTWATSCGLEEKVGRNMTPVSRREVRLEKYPAMELAELRQVVVSGSPGTSEASSALGVER